MNNQYQRLMFALFLQTAMEMLEQEWASNPTPINTNIAWNIHVRQ